MKGGIALKAQTKDFFNEEVEKPSSHKLMVKYIALAVVIFVILLLCVLAWFASKTEATASGLSVKTTGAEGLEVSLDGGNTYATDWGSEEGQQYWAGLDAYNVDKTDSSGTTVGSLMNLLSGNGLNLYYPTGVDGEGNPVKDSDGKYSFVKVDDEDASKYCLEIKAKFRSSIPLKVGLSGQYENYTDIPSGSTTDSFVKPYNDGDATRYNISSITGEKYTFSADYIAGAARVAFINQNTLTGLWIPNKSIELTQGLSVLEFNPLTDDYGGSVTVKTGEFDLEGGKATDMYVHWPTESLPSSGQSDLVNYYNKLDTVQLYETDEYYYCVLTLPVNTNNNYSRDLPFFVTNGEDAEIVNKKINNLVSLTSENLVRSAFDDNGDGVDDNGIGFATGYHIAETINSVYLDDDLYKVYYYNLPVSNEHSFYLIIDKNQNSDGDYVVKSFESVESRDIVISDNTNFLPPDSEIVISREINNKIYGLSGDLNASEQDFSDKSKVNTYVVTNYKEETSSSKSYYSYILQSTNTNKYLAVVNNSLTLVSDADSATYFYVITNNDNELHGVHEKQLAYKDGNELKYVSLASELGSFALTNKNSDTGYMIYTETESGKDYLLETSGEAETSYSYWNGSNVTTLSGYKTKPSDCTNLVTLTKNSDGYYYGDLTIRIFAEGFDREAQKCMEKGKVKAKLVFQGVSTNE
jgi:hypothetical protein